jgi:3-methyladenine DNA glycosylase AlkD
MPSATPVSRSPSAEVDDALAWLKRRGSNANRDGMARYGIVARNVLGVPMGDIQLLAREIGCRHELAEPLWATDCYEARLLVAYVADPARVTPAQMERWTRDFDNWGICDTLTCVLFDKSPHAWRQVDRWASKKEEFVRRAAFALLAALALHDAATPDAPFLERLALIEAAAGDERNFVKKGVSWALRGIGTRSVALRAASIALAERLAASKDATTRWVGKDALRDLTRPVVAKRAAARDAKRAAARAKAAKQAASEQPAVKKPVAKKPVAKKPVAKKAATARR